MTDLFVLLKLPGAGDELQGIKRGVMEMADMIIINKADGEMKSEAERAVRIFKNALHYFTFRNTDEIEVTAVSSLTTDGMDKVIEILENKYTQLQQSGRLNEKRKEQLKFWFDESLNELFRNAFDRNPVLTEKRKELLASVRAYEITPFEAAEALWQLFLKQSKT
jgi:LAO/AO transport system kinase